MASYLPRKLTLFEFLRCKWYRWNFRPDPHTGSCFRGVIDTAEIVSAVSMTPLKPPWSLNLKYHRDFNHKNFFLLNFSGVIDTAETASVVSMTPRKQLWGSGLKFQQCQRHRWNGFCGVIDTAESVSAVSMTPLKRFQRCYWHFWIGFCGVIDTAEIEKRLWESLASFKENIQQNYFPILDKYFQQKNVGEF
jgi:hypothetical protein